MSERTELLQIMALIAVMIVASFFPIPLLGMALAAVRVLLLLVFAVALIYLRVVTRRERLEPVRIQHEEDRLHEIERGR
ncbi:MAG: hypothetical protein JOZ51_03865 [Chloroflexi bacterium]|nr:hypothetical protein [Chloroflexota bacterium]